MATPNIVPRDDSEGGLGTATKYWAAAYIDTIIVGGIMASPHDAANAAADDLVVRGAGDSGITISSGATNTGTIFFGDIASSTIAGIRYNHNTGDMSISAEDDISLDAGGGDINLKDGGSTFARLTNSSSDFHISQQSQDKDISFRGMDGNTTLFTALNLDMSEGGAATFAGDITAKAGTFQAPGDASSIINAFACDDGNNAATFRTTTSGKIFEIKSQNSGTLKFDSTSSTFTGNVTLSSDSSPGLAITDTTNTVTAKIYSQNANSHIGTTTNHPLIIDTNNTAAITIDTSQNATFGGNVNSGGSISTVVASGGADFLNIAFSGNENFSFGARSGTGDDDYIDVGIAGGVRVMSWHEDGKVGIGTTIPEAALTIKGDPTNTNQPSKITNSAQDIHTGLFLNSTGNAVNEKYGMQFGGFNEYSIGGIFGIMDSVSASTSGDITIDMCDGTTANALIERVRFTHEGSVGIGTDAPDAKLSVTSAGTASEDILYLKSGADNADEYLGLAFETGGGGNGPHGAIRVYNGPSGSDSHMSLLTTTDGGTLTKGLTIDHVSNATFAGNITFGDGHTIGDDGDDNLLIASSAGENIIIDSADDIILDAGGDDIRLKVAGTEFGKFDNTSSNLNIYSSILDKDINFIGNDGGSAVTALTLDMSAAGAATFSSTLTAVGDIEASGQASPTVRLTSNDGTTGKAYSLTSRFDGDFEIRNGNTNTLLIDGPTNSSTFAGDVIIPGKAVTTGENNTALGASALATNQTGDRNTAIGGNALATSNATDTNGDNVAVGYNTGASINTGINNVLLGNYAGDGFTTGIDNVAIGNFALSASNAGNRSVAIGKETLSAQNAGSAGQNMYNVAVGYRAGLSVTTGVQNTMVGSDAAVALTTGQGNVAIGYEALNDETTGGQNIAVGSSALGSSQLSQHNVAIGQAALENVTNSSLANTYNIGIGYNAGNDITTGTKNILIGGIAGVAITTQGNNVGIGYNALGACTSSNNIAIGFNAGDAITTGANNIIIGKDAAASAVDASNETVIGTASTASALLHGDTVTFTSANANDSLVVIENTVNDASSARLRFVKSRGADGVDGDDVGIIEFSSFDDGTPSTQLYGQILTEIVDATAGEEGGRMVLNVATHDGSVNRGLLAQGGGVAGEVDVILGNGPSSVTEIAGCITVAGSALNTIPDLTPTFSAITDCAITLVKGTEYLVNDANGGAMVLPAATAGARITINIGTLVTSNTITITAASGDLLKGFAFLEATDAANNKTMFAPDGTDDLIITLDGSTKGGLVGDKIELVGISTTEWRVRATLQHTGTAATPFS